MSDDLFKFSWFSINWLVITLPGRVWGRRWDGQVRLWAPIPSGLHQSVASAEELVPHLQSCCIAILVDPPSLPVGLLNCFPHNKSCTVGLLFSLLCIYLLGSSSHEINPTRQGIYNLLQLVLGSSVESSLLMKDASNKWIVYRKWIVICFWMGWSVTLHLNIDLRYEACREMEIGFIAWNK